MGTSGGGCHTNAQKDRASEGTLRLDRATACAASSKPLKSPVVVCDLGYLLNKEDVIELMLSKALPPHLEHIKSLKALHDATLHANPAHRNAAHLKGQSDEDAEPPFYCPVANLPLNGRYPFVLIKSTGNVVSQRALKQVGGKVCPITEQPISPADALSINPLEEERKEMKAALEAKRAAQAEAKKAKKLAGAGGAGEGSSGGAGEASASDAAAVLGGAPSAAKVGKAKASVPGALPANGGGGNAPAAPAAAAPLLPGGKRPRAEWEKAVAERADKSDVYKSLFISKGDRKKQEEEEAANFCARGIVPSLSRSTKFGLG